MWSLNVIVKFFISYCEIEDLFSIFFDTQNATNFVFIFTTKTVKIWMFTFFNVALFLEK